MEEIRDDFDRIARALAGAPPAAPSPTEAALLARVPPCARVLEVGCGDGSVARLLGDRGARVTGVDLSPEMIALARRRAPTATLEVADFMTWAPPAPFDCVVSIATLHHLPLEAALARMAAALRPGGRLLVHDLVGSRGVADRVRDAVAWAAVHLERRAAPPPDVAAALRAAWAAHAAHDVLVPFAELRARVAAALPGASLRRHLRWRYSLVWTRPAA